MPPPAFSGIEAIDGAVGATVSNVTETGGETELAMPAALVSVAVTSNVPWPCAESVAGGTVTVALPARMSLAVSE